jgi:hypothetical protein
LPYNALKVALKTALFRPNGDSKIQTSNRKDLVEKINLKDSRKNSRKEKTVEQHLNALYSAHTTSERFIKLAEHNRLVKEAKRTQAGSRLSLKQHFGLQLIAFGRKLAQETQPVCVE